VKLLLENGADPDSMDTGGRMPLSCAAEYGHRVMDRLIGSNR